MQTDQDKALAKKGQATALIIAGAMVFWLIMQWAGPKLGMPGRFALLIDLAVMAALIFALVQAFGMWRSRQGKG